VQEFHADEPTADDAEEVAVDRQDRSEEDARDNKVIEKAGFILLSNIPTSYKRDNLYLYPQDKGC